jgi:hypothetical protein
MAIQTVPAFNFSQGSNPQNVFNAYDKQLDRGFEGNQNYRKDLLETDKWNVAKAEGNMRWQKEFDEGVRQFNEELKQKIAEAKSKEERDFWSSIFEVASGAIVGGITGGPVGAVVGAFGGGIGNSGWNSKPKAGSYNGNTAIPQPGTY